MINWSEIYQVYDKRNGGYCCRPGLNFAKWSPAYVSTNEDVREVLRILEPGVNNRVLTVTGSGDQALFYKLAGAGQVDTFDITYNAKMVMDIKTSAIKNLSHEDYVSLLTKMRKVPGSINDMPEYEAIRYGLSQQMQDYVAGVRGLGVCRTGQSNEQILSRLEFDKLKKMLGGEYPFIWTDLYSLAEKLEGKYNQIYLSNILMYEESTDKFVKIISDLGQHLVPGGKILVNVAPWFDEKDREHIEVLQGAVNQWARVRYLKMHDMSMCILQKNF